MGILLLRRSTGSILYIYPYFPTSAMVMYWFINYLEFFLTSLRRCCAVVGRTFDGRRWETGYCGLKEAEGGIEKKEPGRRKTVRRADLRRKARQMGQDHLSRALFKKEVRWMEIANKEKVRWFRYFGWIRGRDICYFVIGFSILI